MGIAWRTTAGVECATATSAYEFIEALRPSNPHWWEEEQCPWVFRGHAREEWQLLPSAWRQANEIIKNCAAEASRRFDAVQPIQNLNWFWHPNFWSSAATFGTEDKKLSRKLTIQTTSEYFLLWDFAERCNDLGMQLPLFGMPDHVQHPNWLAEANNPLVGDDLLRYSDVSAIMALAQHHGIPTRLLDWTRNPMAAAFFAVEFIEPQKDENLVVWALHKQRAKDLTVDGVSFPDSPGQGWKID